MTANEYQIAALRTAGKKKDEDLLLNGIMGLNGEAGECIDILKKHMFQGHKLEKEKMKEELGDVAWYLAVSAYALGYTLDEVLKANKEKLERRYPDGFESKRSIEREEYR